MDIVLGAIPASHDLYNADKAENGYTRFESQRPFRQSTIEWRSWDVADRGVLDVQLWLVTDLLFVAMTFGARSQCPMSLPIQRLIIHSCFFVERVHHV